MSDSLALHEALFAAYDQNWGEAKRHLDKALESLGGEGLPVATRDDWYRSTAVLMHLGYGRPLVEFLEAEGVATTMLPWFAAVQTHTRADKREIENFRAEARPVAEKLFDEIQARRAKLPPP